MLSKESRTEFTRPYTIVLTGGIASGKTTVSEHFHQLEIPIIDTDQIAKTLVKPGTSALEFIAEKFGRGYLLADGNLDRTKIRKLIFSDPIAKTQLEDILHPLISDEVLDSLYKVKKPYCILVIPLFVESSSYRWVDRVVTVDVPEEVQIERVMLRDNIDRRQAEAILLTQASRAERLSVADDIINNDGDVENLHIQISRLHQKYLTLASNDTTECENII